MRTQFTKMFHSTKRHGTGTIPCDFQTDNRSSKTTYFLMDYLKLSEMENYERVSVERRSVVPE